MDSSKNNTCGICLGSMGAGRGEALFTAECCHVFHFNCIATNVQHGNHTCPTCRATWQHLPFQAPPPPPTQHLPFQAPPSPPTSFGLGFYPVRRQPRFPPPPHATFDDDELLPTTATGSSPSSSSEGGIITIKALPEYPALSHSQKADPFTVLVGIQAPPLSQQSSDRPESRAPLDLVAVLDVSGSMHGDKIRLLKQAVNFIVDNLGPMDRLSIVTFSTHAHRVTPLTRMTQAGQADTTNAVNYIAVDGATNIIAGLQVAVQVLEQRRQSNPVSSIILLSDGQDNQNGRAQGFLNSLSVLPACIRSRDVHSLDTVPVPVHTFGFGYDHDATALHAVADVSGGTFSYIESIEVIQDAFAQCIGGLLSVVAQEVEIHAESASPGVRIQSIPSGRYRNNVVDSQHGLVYVGDLYAEEEKQFLVYLLVPEVSESSTMRLLEIKCSYKDPISKESLTTETKTVEIRRAPAESLTEEERRVCVEVDRERNRVSVAQGIAQAQEMAERGELERARSLLSRQSETLLASVAAQSGDAVSNMLENEVREIQHRMSSRSVYESTGRAYALSRKSAHMSQRATTQAVNPMQMQPQGPLLQSAFNPNFGAANSSFSAPLPMSMGYQTPIMKKMVTKSQMLRQSTKEGDGEASNTSHSHKP